MWLADFRMRSAKKLEVHRNLHIDSNGHKVVTLENMEVCCIAWYTIHAVSNADFYSSKVFGVGLPLLFSWQLGHEKTYGCYI